MKMWRTKAFRTLYFYLITAGFPSLLLSVLIGNSVVAIPAYLFGILLCFPLSLLPGHIGKRNLPLRVPVMVAAAIAIAVQSTIFASNLGLLFARGTGFGVLIGVLMLFCVRDACLEYPLWTGQYCATIGVVLYAIPAVSFLVTPTDDMLLNNFIWIMSIAFLAVTAFYLNGQNVRTGLATRKNANPPKSLSRGNRVLTIIFSAFAALVVFWGQLRDATVRFGKWLAIMFMKLVHWLANLFGAANTSGGGGEEQMNPGEALGLGTSEPSTFWLIMEKIMIVFTVVAFAVLVFFAGRVVFRLIRKLIRRLREYMAQFAQTAGEDYEDEQVDLFDLDDLREQTKERLQRVVKRFTQRAPKWESMSPSEKVRYCVRSLYGRAGYSNGELRSLTIREAAGKLPGTDFGEERLASLYEKARYSEIEPSEQETSELRKAVKP